MTQQERDAIEGDPGGLIYPIPPPVANPVDTSCEAAVRRNRAQCAKWNVEIEAKKEQARVEEERRKAAEIAAHRRAYRESLFRGAIHRQNARLKARSEDEKRKRFVDELTRRRAARGM